ncbi:unnamed protein product [Menidia menidia]|uniref:(Atlantic silverside) hypothetical protein n=1 Tax=Menidia menidia TaxID=238744 RepID=A0A8S4AGE7_9TELE|nr:unnamed protein product [Menidia menidia]
MAGVWGCLGVSGGVWGILELSGGVWVSLGVSNARPPPPQSYQSSPGGQSSCSSEPSPLSSANNTDSGVEMALHSGGSFGDLSAQDDCPMVDSTVAAGGQQVGVGLQLRKAAGGPVTIKLENIKKERLRTVRESCPWIHPQPPQGPRDSMKLPPIPAVGSLLDGSGLLDPYEVTLLSQRRGSGSSTLSSAYSLSPAYSLSRRSSGISPCGSSRRSSEASHCGGRRHHNLSSADSYDPISTDLSRRSSEASHCGGGGGGGGLPSMLSLTPAQHYRLKAKYAAATGGAPPTPLPNMERMSLRTRMALYSEPHEGAAPPPRQPPPRGPAVQRHRLRPTRCAGPPPDPPAFPRAPRYGSLSGALNGVGALSGERQLALAGQGYTRSDGSLQRHPFAPRPPSISENVAMETMAVDGLMAGGEDDLVLPDDVVQYLRSQNSGPSGQNPGQGGYTPSSQTRGTGGGSSDGGVQVSDTTRTDGRAKGEPTTRLRFFSHLLVGWADHWRTNRIRASPAHPPEPCDIKEQSRITATSN